MGTFSQSSQHPTGTSQGLLMKDPLLPLPAPLRLMALFRSSGQFVADRSNMRPEHEERPFDVIGT
jgi:hypothetical protein